MTAVKISLDAAPTTMEEMLKMGRFNYRILAQELGMFNSEAEKAAFMQMASDKQAEALLAEVIRAKGGKGAAAAAAAPTGRTPSTGKGKKPAEAPAPEEAPINDPAAARAPVTAAAAAGTANLVKQLGAIVASVEGIQEAVQGGNQSIITLQETLEGIRATMIFNTALSLLQIEHLLAGQMSRDDIVGMALSEIPAIRDMLGGITGESSPEEDPEEGNE